MLVEDLFSEEPSGDITSYALNSHWPWKRSDLVTRSFSIARSYGIPNVGKAPYYIVAAEQKGIPRVEQRSLAHCMQNMWLKATALGLGFQLLSITAEMAEDREFCSLIDIPFGQFALDGCLIGYADRISPPSSQPCADEVTRWID
jgi:nitroreductase